MTATILAGLLGALLGIVAGAMTLDRYHERMHAALLAMADAERIRRTLEAAKWN